MAEAVLRNLADEHVHAFSAGLATKPIKPTVFEVMEEEGYSLEGHTSKTLEEIAGQEPFDYAVIVCKAEENQCPGLSDMAKQTLYWEIEGPFPGRKPVDFSNEEKLVHYRCLRDQVYDKVVGFINGLGLPTSTPTRIECHSS